MFHVICSSDKLEAKKPNSLYMASEVLSLSRVTVNALLRPVINSIQTLFYTCCIFHIDCNVVFYIMHSMSHE